MRLIEADWHRQDDGELNFLLELADWTTLLQLSQNGRLAWTDIALRCEVTDDVRKVRIVGGEGSWGSNGFVAAIQFGTNEIVWIAFFSTSNPFVEVKIAEDAVLAKTNLNTWWRFPLDAPDRVMLQRT